MGGTKDFVEKRIFEYKGIGTVGGFKIIEGVDNRHNLPNFSNTSTGYVKLSNNVPHQSVFIKIVRNLRILIGGMLMGILKQDPFMCMIIRMEFEFTKVENLVNMSLE